MEPYLDRVDAGQQLARHLGHLAGSRPLVLGVPRGGVIVAAEVARALDGDLDVAIARKLGAPANPELAIGAMAAGGAPIFDAALVRHLGVPAPYLAQVVERERIELDRRRLLYRPGRPPLDTAGRVVVVVDDGVATGATLRAVLASVAAMKPDRLVCAVPCGPPETISKLAELCDEIVCPLQPHFFRAVGEWFRDFRQVEDDDVAAAIEGAR